MLTFSPKAFCKRFNESPYGHRARIITCVSGPSPMDIGTLLALILLVPATALIGYLAERV